MSIAKCMPLLLSELQWSERWTSHRREPRGKISQPSLRKSGIVGLAQWSECPANRFGGRTDPDARALRRRNREGTPTGRYLSLSCSSMASTCVIALYERQEKPRRNHHGQFVITDTIQRRLRGREVARPCSCLQAHGKPLSKQTVKR